MRAAASSRNPVANYGLLADCNSAALVDSDGSIDWLCLPRYDSDASLATEAGLDPASTFESTWSYEFGDEETVRRALVAPAGIAALVGPDREDEVKDAIVSGLATTAPPTGATGSRTPSIL